MAIRPLVIVACGVFVVLAAPRAGTTSSDITLTDHVVAVGRREAVSLHAQPQSQAPSQARKKPGKLKAALIGAAIGGGIGAVWGTAYCNYDCGGGRPRGATVFGLAGAGIGAAAGFVVALLLQP